MGFLVAYAVVAAILHQHRGLAPRLREAESAHVRGMPAGTSTLTSAAIEHLMALPLLQQTQGRMMMKPIKYRRCGSSAVAMVGDGVSDQTVGEPMTDASPALLELIRCVAKLGRECPWTAEQSPSSMLAFLESEISELRTALEEGALRSDVLAELGDILFNTLLLTEVCARYEQASEVPISTETAAAASVSKLRRRYPPLFDGTLSSTSIEEANSLWVAGKAAEAGGSVQLAGAAGSADAQIVRRSGGDEFDCEEDAILAAEIAELDRLERLDAQRKSRQLDIKAREELARLVMEEIARDAEGEADGTT